MLVELPTTPGLAPEFVKVIAVDNATVHLRIYARNTPIDLPANERTVEVEHMPITSVTWAEMDARLLGKEKVMSNELTEYEAWRKDPSDGAL
jgi:hypothetical protein